MGLVNRLASPWRLLSSRRSTWPGRSLPSLRSACETTGGHFSTSGAFPRMMPSSTRPGSVVRRSRAARPQHGASRGSRRERAGTGRHPDVSVTPSAARKGPVVTEPGRIAARSISTAPSPVGGRSGNSSCTIAGRPKCRAGLLRPAEAAHRRPIVGGKANDSAKEALFSGCSPAATSDRLASRPPSSDSPTSAGGARSEVCDRLALAHGPRSPRRHRLGIARDLPRLGRRGARG